MKWNQAAATVNQNCASDVEAQTTDKGARNAQPEGSAAMRCNAQNKGMFKFEVRMFRSEKI